MTTLIQSKLIAIIYRAEVLTGMQLSYGLVFHCFACVFSMLFSQSYSLSKITVINPRRVCAVRVTVLALSVCVCVCSLYHYRSSPSSLRPQSSTYRFIIGFCWNTTRGFSKEPSVQEFWRHLFTTITAARSMALFSTG